MRLADLQKTLNKADPSAVLVSPRVLERILQEVYDLPRLRWTVPHRKSCVVDRQTLFRHVDQEELALESDQLLPDTVILLQRPGAEELADPRPENLLLRCWRRLFHANVHLTLSRRQSAGHLTDADLQARIAQIGPAEFAEIRTVLTQDGYLPADADDRTVYTEFAAVYLDLHHFAAGLLPTYFPGLGDLERIDLLLAQDVDARELFTRTRLDGAPNPVVLTDTNSDETHEFYWKLIQSAERTARSGNLVRAAILRRRAARVAPASLVFEARSRAVAELEPLTKRLQTALQLSDAEAAEWLKDLAVLLDRADQGSNPVEALILFDLQKLCLDNERDIYALDLVEWLLSGGRRPIKRSLAGQRLVRIVSHLRQAAQRLTLARLSDADRRHLGGLLEGALRHTEERLRQRCRPVLVTAMEDVGLRPANPPERAAFDKMVEELLNRITAHGFFTFSDLRDVLSRNLLKLPDLSSPQEFTRGDPLLRLDRRLSTMLDGIYRPSEIYMRLLERFTALNFGTATGRLITLHVTLPFGGAFLLLEALNLILGMFHVEPLPAVAEYAALPVLGLFLLGLLHSPSLRQQCVRFAMAAYRPLRWLFFDLPLWVVRIPSLHRLVTSWTFQLFYWYLFKPLLACALLWLVVPQAFGTVAGAAGIFLGVNFLLNSRFGRTAQELVRQSFAGLLESLRAGLLPGLVRLVIRVFKEVTDAVEYVLFTVDEWLRFRGGDSRASMVVRAVLSLFWYPVSYLARFYMVVLIEPMINPLKLPISILAAKVVYPMLAIAGLFELEPFPSSPLVDDLSPYMTYPLAWLLVIGTFYLLPDAFGFLAWELKENWSLYRANRPGVLPAVGIGAHGETMTGLLHPGFHSGTVPRLFARLRTAERRGVKYGTWHAARAYRRELHEIEKALRLFVELEMLCLLRQATSWQGLRPGLGRVVLATNRIRIELVHGDFPERPVWLEFRERFGWLLAEIAERGWLEHLTQEQARALNTALAGLYKRAGVDLVREQVAAGLPPRGADYDLNEHGLVLWLDRVHAQAVCYPLRAGQERLEPRAPGGGPAADWPVLEARRLVFARVPVSWEQMVQSWQKDQDGQGHPRLVSAGVEVELLGTAAATPPAPTPAPQVLALDGHSQGAARE
jgi:hypothetical protein